MSAGYSKKSDWADAKADELFMRARELQFEPSFRSTYRAARKYRGVAALEAEGNRFRGIAKRLREKGQ